MNVQALSNPQDAAAWLRAHVSGDLHGNDRGLRTGDGFLAWPGRRHDARAQVAQALGRGVGACLMEAEGAQPWVSALTSTESVATYAGLKVASGPIADAFYGQPSRSLPLVAITGTNGKTSISWWLAQALSALGLRSAVMGTLGWGELLSSADPNGWSVSQPHGHDGLTTPDAIGLHRQLHRWRAEGLAAVVMEASSIGLEEGRLGGACIDTAVFTNLTPDHLDYHGTMQAYGQAKARLFDWDGLRRAVVNVDDPFGRSLALQLQQHRPEVSLWTVSATPEGQALSAQHVQCTLTASADPQHLPFELNLAGQPVSLHTRLLGGFNRHNLAMVAAVLLAWGQDPQAVAEVLPALQPVPGRMQRLGDPTQPQVVIDYAHTPDAVTQVLTEVRQMAQLSGGRVITVLGCGGDRDVTKRPVMAREAQRLSDGVWITSDNPRNESAQAIARDMLEGLDDPASVQVQLDRGLAIAQAIAQARANDWVVVAGKGHETHQEVAGVRHPFSDAVHAQANLNAWRAA